MKSNETQKVQMDGQDLQCPICKNENFWKRKAQLNTAVASFFNVDWANRSATCFVCSHCTHIMWFLNEE